MRIFFSNFLLLFIPFSIIESCSVTNITNGCSNKNNISSGNLNDTTLAKLKTFLSIISNTLSDTIIIKCNYNSSYC
jgi:hypothetical protein